MVRTVVAAALLAVAAAGCGATGPARRSGRVPTPPSTSSAALKTESCEPGARIPAASHGPPAVTLPCLGSGASVHLAGLRGRPTVVNVWASWCYPCREELPLLQAAHRRWGRSIRMLGVDSRDETSSATAFLVATGVTFPQAVDTSGQLPTRLGSPGLPITIGIDAAGAVVYKHAGQLAAGDLATIYQRLRSR